jgi:predicted dehydrogenase
MSPVLTAAVAGCGPRGREHAVALGEIPRVRLVAVADPAADRRQAAGREFGVAAFPELDELLDGARPDVVVLATPPADRGELVERAAAAASVRAVVTEKPMAPSLAEAQRMLTACAAAGTVLTVCHQLRFCPGFAALEQAVARGELGAIELVRGVAHGGLLDQGPHLFDAMRWLAGDRCLQWAMSQRGEGGTSDWTTHHLAFEGGLRAVMETGPLHQRGRDFVDPWLDKRVTVIGSEGVGEAQAAGGWRILTSRRKGWAGETGDLNAYRGATRAFHERLVEVLHSDGVHPCNGRDAILTLEGVLACAQSAVDGAMARLPLDPGRDQWTELSGADGSGASRRPIRLPGSRERPRSPAPAPDVSVIVALPDHRGRSLDCVRSWVEQDLAPDRYELLIGSDAADPALDDRIRPALRPDDRLLVLPGAHEIELYDWGARAARGRILLFSEPHCTGEPACLSELLAFLAARDYSGACLRSTGLSPNGFARLEEELYEEGFSEWSREGDWRKVILRGFALYRDVYAVEGGFECAYGRFAEWAFAARLHRAGRRLGYASGAAVRHHYTERWGDLAPAIRDFTRGECAYRLDYPREYCERYFGAAPEWSDRRRLDARSARAACHAALRNLVGVNAWRHRGRLARAMLRILPGLLIIGLTGPRGPVTRARWALRAARARYLLWRSFPARRRRAFRDAWDRLTHLSRLEWLADQGPVTAPETPRAQIPASDIPDERVLGLHPLERWNGSRPFRWTGPLAVLDLPVPEGSREVRIGTEGLRNGSDPLCLRLWVNGRRLAPDSLRVGEREVAFPLGDAPLRPQGEQRFVLSCIPLEPWRTGSPDRRRLGLPIASLEFIAREAGEGSEAQAGART